MSDRDLENVVSLDVRSSEYESNNLPLRESQTFLRFGEADWKIKGFHEAKQGGMRVLVAGFPTVLVDCTGVLLMSLLVDRTASGTWGNTIP